MARTSIISFIAITAGIGSALAAGAGLENHAPYGDTITSLTTDEVASHATASFLRADANSDGFVNVDEYAALTIVTAELSLLNGFIALQTGSAEEKVELPFGNPGALTRGERARIEAVARSEFYQIAGDDSTISHSEFHDHKASKFAEADRNRNGKLAKAELQAFAAAEANVTYSGV